MNSFSKLTLVTENDDFVSRVNKLTSLSRERVRHTFGEISWPDKIDTEAWWLPPELLSVHGTRYEQEMSLEQKKLLSKWECINLFSLNVEGERELVSRLSSRLYQPEVPGLENYLHHFIDEENKHMWFFGEFCRRYGGKIYSSKKMAIAEETYSPEMEYFLLFARIGIFEEIGAYFNVAAASDERMDPFVRQIHQIHHADEARHITFGRALLAQTKELAFASSSAEQRDRAIAHLQRYVQISVEALYQPAMYRDSGISSGVAMRRELLNDGARRKLHEESFLKRPLRFFADLGIHLTANPQ
ncbi:MAG: diiron oxygenase [Rhodanobacteraceae bacterium]|nr:diiron oxygenase [Rhodanobacteraceae bacterium]